MGILVTGSSGHLGEALMRLLPGRATGLDLVPGPWTGAVGSIGDRGLLAELLQDVDAVIHTATLHKPHIVTHTHREFVDTNITGTLNLLEAAAEAAIGTFILTSTTSAFGAALTPPPGALAAWIDEQVRAQPRNIYGVTKTAAEDLCELFHRQHGLYCLILRVARMFPEPDDAGRARSAFADENLKANEFLHRRVDLEDAALAHLVALEAAPRIGFGRYIISATTPFARTDLARLRTGATGLVAERLPEFEAVYRSRGYRMFAGIDRVYDSARARAELGWRPKFDFARILGQLAAGLPIGSELAREVGIKGYHQDRFPDGMYPVADD